MKIIKEFQGDGGNLLLTMLQKGKRYFVNVIVFSANKIISKGFNKRKNAEKYYAETVEKF